jgi:hypothetical protein
LVKPFLRIAAWAAESRSASIARQVGKGFFGARDRIVEIFFGDAPQHLLQRIGLRDHMMVSEGLDLERAGLVFRHDDFLSGSR